MAVMMTYALMWLSRRVAARTICLSFQQGRLTTDLALDPVLYTFVPTTCHHLGFERLDLQLPYRLSGRVTSLCIRSILSNI